jgi:putative Holliday junction resolvase
VSRILGLDIGDQRMGLALSDSMGILASPLIIIERTSDEQAVKAILKIVSEREVERIIVGLPLSLGGDIGHQAKKVQSFTEILQQHTTIPIEYRDERFTTATAKQLKQEAGTRKLNRRTRYDAMAAAVILQEYLDEKASQVRQS